MRTRRERNIPHKLIQKEAPNHLYTKNLTNAYRKQLQIHSKKIPIRSTILKKATQRAFRGHGYSGSSAARQSCTGERRPGLGRATAMVGRGAHLSAGGRALLAPSTSGTSSTCAQGIRASSGVNEGSRWSAVGPHHRQEPGGAGAYRRGGRHGGRPPEGATARGYRQEQRLAASGWGCAAAGGSSGVGPTGEGGRSWTSR
jgi:hypothetical protein